jgi:putative heme-binding domain-containing protein
MAALELLLRDDPARLVREAQATLARPALAEKQLAIALLAKAAIPAADEALRALGDSLLNGSVALNLKLDVLEALRARGPVNTALAGQLATYEKQPAAAAQDELTAGGDIARGRDIVSNHLNANCTACHTVEVAGGSEVGPNLRAIGASRDARYLLESLLTPSAQIATGYGLVSITLKDKTEISGTLAKETPDAVTIRFFDGRRQVIKRADIVTQTAPASIMPPMGAILQPRELRDVVTYLGSLKGGRNRAAKKNDEEH